MSDLSSTSPRSIDEGDGGRGRGWRVVGTIVGVALVVAALVVAVTRTPFDEVVSTLLRPDRSAVTLLAMLALATIGGIFCSAEVLLRLTRRFGSVGRREMFALVAASTLLNYLPLRPGLVGRVAWHRVVNGIPTIAVARTVIEASVITVVVGGALVAGLLLSMPLAFGAASTLFASLALPLAVAIGCACTGALRIYAIPAFMRLLELMLWAVRVHAAFALVGVDLSVAATLGLTAAAAGASMIPLVGNGLGVREWTIGALAPVLASVDLARGVSADLLSRAIEVTVIVPIGLVALAWLARRRRELADASASASAGTETGAGAMASAQRRSDRSIDRPTEQCQDHGP